MSWTEVWVTWAPHYLTLALSWVSTHGTEPSAGEFWCCLQAGSVRTELNCWNPGGGGESVGVGKTPPIWCRKCWVSTKAVFLFTEPAGKVSQYWVPPGLLCPCLGTTRSPLPLRHVLSAPQGLRKKRQEDKKLWSLFLYKRLSPILFFFHGSISLF